MWNKRSRNVLNALIFTYVDTNKMSKKEAKTKILDLDINYELFDKTVESLSNEEFIEIVNNIKI